MRIDEAIDRFKKYIPLTIVDKEAFELAVHCMEFTLEFLPLCETPERMKQAINLLNSLEYALINTETKKQLLSIVGYDMKD